MSHGKAFLLGGVGTVQGRLGWAHETLKQIFDEYEPLITSTNWVSGQDFECINYVVRFGPEKLDKIEIRKPNKYGELPVASQLSMEELHEVFLNKPKLRDFIETEVKRVLLYLKEKYNLSPIPELGL